MKRLLFLLAVLLLPAARARAADPVDYGPVPHEIAAVVADEKDRALLDMALAAVRRGPQGSDAEPARALLVLLGDVGLRGAAERLAEGGTGVEERTALLMVAASSEHPQADTLLERAAREPRPLYRMLAASGLGRGRGPKAVPALARLARDPVPAVRIAALRSLFALESPQAAAARIALPADTQPSLLARRLRWHRRCGDVRPELRALALEAYSSAARAPLRMAAARYLTLPEVGTPVESLELIVREMGGGPLMAWLVRTAHGASHADYDEVAMRATAIQAILALLARKDQPPARRRAWLEQAVAWVARPISMDPYQRDPIPEHELRRRLPDLGRELAAPVTARLARHAFDDPRSGVILLRELGSEIALPILRGFLAPRTARPPLESAREAQQRRYLRNAAAGAVQELGRIEDEALARALLVGPEAQTLKVEIVHALAHDEGAWVVPLLGEIMQGKNAELRSHAIGILEARPEAEARAMLIEDLFQRGERPHDRMRPLVRRGDELAITVLQRALGDKRSFLRKAALSQFSRRRNPRLCGEEGRALLAAHMPALTSPQEIQDYVYALLNVDPMRAVRFVKDTWAKFPTDGVRTTVLRILGETRGREAREEAIDFALTHMTPRPSQTMLLSCAAVLMGPTGQYDWTYRAEEISVHWRAMLDSDSVVLQREALRAWWHEKAPRAEARLLELLARALSGKALPPRDSTPEGEQAFARDVIRVLIHQPWDKVEAQVLDVATGSLSEINTRVVAAQLLIGRLSPSGRQRLMRWLDYMSRGASGQVGEAPGRHAEFLLQLFLAAAIGEGAGPEVAALLYDTLQRELWAFYNPERLQALVRERPVALREQLVGSRVVALARGIGRTRHEPTILGLLDVVFDPRFATYARACVHLQGRVAHAAGPGAAALRPSKLALLGHNEEGSTNWGMPRAVHDLLYETKLLDDDVLAAGLTRTLTKARADGRLAGFPVLYMVRVLTNVLEPHTGRKPKTADVVLRFARHMGRADGALHYFLHQHHVQGLAESGRFEQAARTQRDLVRVVARGNHDDTSPGEWLLQRAMQDALEGAAAAQRGDADAARERFRRAVLRAPNDPQVLNGAAWYQALAGFGLEQAEQEAVRATTLEARVENRPSPNAADTLAYVLLHRDRAGEGLRVLEPRMRERGAHDNGLMNLHMAQLYTATGRLRSARDALVEALTWDRALLTQARTDPFLRPLLEKATLESIEARAAQSRLEEKLP